MTSHLIRHLGSPWGLTKTVRISQCKIYQNFKTFQRAIYQHIVDSLAQRQRFLDQANGNVGPSCFSWCKYCVLLGKPCTGKSQVLIRAIHHALQQEAAVLLAAPVTLLAQGYSTTFGSDLESNTLRATFHIPVNENQSLDVTFGMNKFNMVVVEEASLVSPESFNIIAGNFNCLNCPPIMAITGDKHQQQPLKTVHGRVSTTVSILNDHTFNQNSKHGCSD